MGKITIIISIITVVIMSCLAPIYAAKDYQGSLKNYLGNKQYPDDFWQVSNPKNEGMDNRKLEQSLQYIDQNGYKIHSFLIIRNGKLVFERYGIDNELTDSVSTQQTPNVLHHLWSTTKTFTSALIGIAISEGKIPGVKAKVMDFFRNDPIANMSDEKNNITVENLLTMQSGINFDDSLDIIPMLRDTYNSSIAVLSKPMMAAPGGTWNYSTGNSQILVEIIRRTTGKTPLEYAKEKIFDKIGIKDFVWYRDRSGTEYGGLGLFLRPRDLARFGYLYLKKGKWNGVSVIPEDWITESTKAHSETPWTDGIYGYHCWLPRIGGFATSGRLGQKIYIFPDNDLIVVFTANIPSENGLSTIVEDHIVQSFVLPACTNKK